MDHYVFSNLSSNGRTVEVSNTNGRMFRRIGNQERNEDDSIQENYQFANINEMYISSDEDEDESNSSLTDEESKEESNENNARVDMIRRFRSRRISINESSEFEQNGFADYYSSGNDASDSGQRSRFETAPRLSPYYQVSTLAYNMDEDFENSSWNSFDSTSSIKNEISLKYGRLVVQMLKKLIKQRLVKNHSIDKNCFKRVFKTFYKKFDSDKQAYKKSYTNVKKFMECLIKLPRLASFIDKLDFGDKKNYNDILFIRLTFEVYNSYFKEYDNPLQLKQRLSLLDLELSFLEKLTEENLKFFSDELDHKKIVPLSLRQKIKSKQASVNSIYEEKKMHFYLGFGTEDSVFYKYN